jgi:hypothetical protein
MLIIYTYSNLLINQEAWGVWEAWVVWAAWGVWAAWAVWAAWVSSNILNLYVTTNITILNIYTN